jgi:hypothetical protein
VVEIEMIHPTALAFEAMWIFCCPTSWGWAITQMLLVFPSRALAQFPYVSSQFPHCFFHFMAFQLDID